MPYSMPDKERKAKLAAQLEKAIEAITTLNPEKVILFGSFNHGDLNSRSDIDLLVVWDTDLPFLERTQVFYDAIQPDLAMDILIYTPEEIERLQENNPFIRKALAEGRVIYEKGT